MLELYLVYQKSEPPFVKDFLGDNEIQFIETLYTVILGYYQHFYVVSKTSVAYYGSIVKFKTTSQKCNIRVKFIYFKLCSM